MYVYVYIYVCIYCVYIWRAFRLAFLQVAKLTNWFGSDF